VKGGDDLSGKGDGGASEKLVQYDRDGVEPVKPFIFRAEGDAFVIVAFTIAPQADCVEIMESEGASDGVDQQDIARDGFRKDA